MNLRITLAGLAATLLPSAVTANQTLIPAGATWKYLDNGTNQASAWRAPAFDDSLWAQGPAQLGYGDADEATVVGYGGVTTNRYITTYFRKSFTVVNPADFAGLNLRVLCDDGAVIYVNGVEVRRDNMPAGAIAYTTVASTALGSPQEATFYDTTLSTANFVAGTNTIAVEIHQSGPTSSDISFDLELTGVDTPALTRGPYLQQATPTGMIVRWRTDLATAGRVAFGTSAASLTGAVDETSAVTEHEVQLTGLLPDTQYFYSVGTPAATLASGPDFMFYTAPPAGTARPTRVWVLGDSGTANTNAAAVRDAYTSFSAGTYTDVWLMLGDNAYNTGTDAEYQAAVFNMYPAFLRQSPLWSTIGNHETAQSTNPPLTIPYFNIFSLPSNGEGGGVPSGTEKYYSFDYANIHFVCLDSMTSSRAANGAMATWLQNDLASTVQQWIIAFWHHPAYTKGSHNSDTETELVEMRQNLLPHLEAGGVDLVMAGHSHCYERSYLLNGHYGLSGTLTAAMKLDDGSGRADGTGAYAKPGNNAANQGAVYITAGSSGQATGGTLNHPAMYLSLNNLGSMVLDINGPQINATFLRENGAAADYFTINKSVPNVPPVVAVTSPADGAVFTAPANVAITASASDTDGTVVQVDFYQGGTPIGSDTTAPFEITWSGAPSGTHLLTATTTDNLGATVTSDGISITINNPEPAAPAGLTATAGNAQVALTWTASAGAASYAVHRAGVSGGPYTVIAPSVASASYTDTALINGTAYFYVVFASNAAGTSPASNQASATPVAPPALPAAPSALTATAVSKSQINLTWTDNSNNETGFKVERKQGNGAWSQITVTAADATGFASTGLVANKTYSYRVRATGAAGDSAYSNTATAATPRK